MDSRRSRPRDRQLHLAPVRHNQRRPRLDPRSALRNHAGDGQLRRAAHLHLLHRLHGPRRKLHPLLLLPLALCRSHAGRRHLQQHPAPVHELGTGRPHLLPAHRILVSQALRRRSRQEGIPHNAHRRHLLSPRNRLALLRNGHLALLQPRRRLHGRLGTHRPIGAARGSRPYRRRRHRPAHLRRSSRQKWPASSPRVAARRDGRPHARLRAHSRGHHGCRRRLSHRPRLPAHAGRCPHRWNHDRPHRRHLGRRIHRGLRSAHCGRPERHQAHPRLLHRLATRIHDGRPRPRRRRCRHVPPHHPRLFQGPPLHGRRLRDSRRPRGTGHPPHGRPQVRHAAHLHHLRHRHAGPLRIPARLLRLLEQGRNS